MVMSPPLPTGVLRQLMLLLARTCMCCVHVLAMAISVGSLAQLLLPTP